MHKLLLSLITPVTAMRYAVLSHNIMDGLHIDRLLPRYARQARRLERFGGLGLFCVQENARFGALDAADRIAHALARAGGGQKWAVARCAEDPRLATVVDARRWRVRRGAGVALPVLDALSPLERTYIRGGAPEQKYAQTTSLAPRDGGPPLAVVNVHLDAAGDNAHRARQAAVAAAAVGGGRVLAAGDTNCFAASRAAHAAALDDVLAPLRALGAEDAHAAAPADTHWFARTTETGVGHRLARALGALGVDAPRRYDVIAATARPVAAGYLRTPESDHDAVWAAFNA